MLIPFSRLYLSDANVRKTRSEEDDIQLSADIEARGLLQNLLVTKSKKRGKFAVIAGGRRLRAIEMMLARPRSLRTSSASGCPQLRNAGLSSTSSRKAAMLPRSPNALA